MRFPYVSYVPIYRVKETKNKNLTDFFSFLPPPFIFMFKDAQKYKVVEHVTYDNNTKQSTVADIGN